MPAILALMALRRDLTVWIGVPAWTTLSCVAFALAAWAAVRLWRPSPLLIASPDGIAVPRLIRTPVPWSDIIGIDAITHRHRSGDIGDRLLIRLNQPMELEWQQARLRRIFAGLPQSAIGIDMGLRWPMRGEALRDVLLEAARDFAAGGGDRSASSRSRRQSPWTAVLAIAIGAALPIAYQVSDMGPPRFFSEALTLYAKGETATAVPLLEADARAGDSAAAVALGTLYLNGDGVARNPSMSAAWFRRAAEAGDPGAAYSLGNAYRLGLGVPADMNAAIRWYEAAAEADSAEAAFALSRLYRLGDGVRRDYPRAIEWLNRAVADGFAPAMQDLGQLYHEGLGVTRDPETAKSWYRKAADAGSVAARHDLARLMLDGDPAERDQGLRYLAEAAETGYAPAQRRIAAVFATGQGLPADPVAALKWITLAERAWPPATRADLVREKARIQAYMSDADIAAATEQVRLWRPLRASE